MADNTTDNKRILFATDIPFWRKSDGAEQRIFAIYRFLQNEGFHCGVFFLGKLDDRFKQFVTDNQIEIFECVSDEPPEKLMSRIRWYADATVHQARNWLFREPNATVKADGPASLTLADFDWSWAKTRFAEKVAAFKPDVIVFEYIKMHYLMDGLSAEQRSAIRCIVDTHDVLHRRAEQFFANGFPHWLKITRQQEADVLTKFNTVIAIQQQEAQTFAEMTDSQVQIITVGHAVDEGGLDEQVKKRINQTPEKIVVGYIGSKNFSNWQAIQQFLHNAWPSVVAKHPDTCELVVAGGICDWFERDENNQPFLKSSDVNVEGDPPLELADSDTLQQPITRPVSYTHLTLPTIYSV